MNTALETAIVEQLHTLDERHQAEVFDFVQFLAAKSRAAPATEAWPTIDPARDLAQYIGVPTGFPEDGVAYQRQIRDTEWP